MKKLVLALVASFLFCSGVFAQDSFRATINDVDCTTLKEPVGDTCLVFTTQESGSKLAIVFHYGPFVNTNSYYSYMVGKRANIFETNLSQIDDYEMLRVLKAYDAEYFYLTSSGDGSEIRILKK